jgi:phosphoglycolate phosphatase
MNGPYQLLVFDWDGTLMDSEARIVACMEAAFADLGLPALGTEAVRNVIGLGLREAMDRLYPGGDEALQQRLVDRYRHHYLVVDSTPSALFPGAREVVEGLAEAGYFLAVATGKGRGGLDRVLQETGLGPCFHVTRCADETRSKPHPQMLLEIMQITGVDPRDTLMIGDSEYDMEMAVHAGAASLAVSYGVHSCDRLRRHAPLHCLESILELPAWLGGSPSVSQARPAPDRPVTR